MGIVLVSSAFDYNLHENKKLVISCDRKRIQNHTANSQRKPCLGLSLHQYQNGQRVCR